MQDDFLATVAYLLMSFTIGLYVGVQAMLNQSEASMVAVPVILSLLSLVLLAPRAWPLFLDGRQDRPLLLSFLRECFIAFLPGCLIGAYAISFGGGRLAMVMAALLAFWLVGLARFLAAERESGGEVF